MPTPPADPPPPFRRRFAREAGATARLAGPIVGGQLASTGLNFVDTVMAGRLGPEALGAVAVGASVFASLSFLPFGTLLAVPPWVAALDAGGRRGEVAPFARQALWVGWAMAAAVALVLAFAARPALVLLDIHPDLVPTTAGYLRGLAWGLPSWALYLTLRFTSEGLGASRPALYFGLLGLPVNALANWLLMYGVWGFPRLGAVGCGHATSVVWTAQALAMLVYVARHPRYRGLGLLDRLERPRAATMRRLLRVGLPAGGMIFVEGSIFTAVALVLGTLGSTVVAAHQVALNFAAMTFMVPLGLSMAISVRVGRAMGLGDPHAVRFSAGVGVAMALGCQVVSAAVMALAPRAVAGLYTDDPRVIALAVELLLLAAVFQLSDGVQVSAAGALRGIRDTRVPMAIVVVAYWLVGFPLGYLLAFAAGLGARGLWIGLIAGLTVAAALLAARFHRVSARPERWAG